MVYEVAFRKILILAIQIVILSASTMYGIVISNELGISIDREKHIVNETFASFDISDDDYLLINYRYGPTREYDYNGNYIRTIYTESTSYSFYNDDLISVCLNPTTLDGNTTKTAEIDRNDAIVNIYYYEQKLSDEYYLLGEKIKDGEIVCHGEYSYQYIGTKSFERSFKNGQSKIVVYKNGEYLYEVTEQVTVIERIAPVIIVCMFPITFVIIWLTRELKRRRSDTNA